MRIPRFLVTVPYLHSYDLSDIFYHNDMGMVKLTRIRFQILCVFDLKVAGKKFVYSFLLVLRMECLLYVLKYLKIRKIVLNILEKQNIKNIYNDYIK